MNGALQFDPDDLGALVDIRYPNWFLDNPQKPIAPFRKWGARKGDADWKKAAS
ncbi:MAG: hypothetical protein ABI036_13230 [Fibrobacteria bacterium]